MGTTCKIRCKHCGAAFDLRTNASYGPPSGGRTRREYIETETAIRCPVCLGRLNTSQEEFRRQVEVTYTWN